MRLTVPTLTIQNTLHRLPAASSSHFPVCCTLNGYKWLGRECASPSAWHRLPTSNAEGWSRGKGKLEKVGVGDMI